MIFQTLTKLIVFASIFSLALAGPSSGRGKGGKMMTSAPTFSASPSTMPSVSAMPSDVPTDTPSFAPSVSSMPSDLPSDSPTMAPSISFMPSESASPTACGKGKGGKGSKKSGKGSTESGKGTTKSGKGGRRRMLGKGKGSSCSDSIESGSISDSIESGSISDSFESGSISDSSDGSVSVDETMPVVNGVITQKLENADQMPSGATESFAISVSLLLVVSVAFAAV